MAFCMGECVKLYGKCEECVMRRIGKYNKDDASRRRSSGHQIVVITHQPIGNRPRLVSEHDLAANSNQQQQQVGSPQLERTHSTRSSAFHTAKGESGRPDYSKYRKSAYQASIRRKDGRKGDGGELSPDEDADVCSPMLATKPESVQPSLEKTNSTVSSVFSGRMSDSSVKALSQSAVRVRSGSSSGDDGSLSTSTIVGAQPQVGMTTSNSSGDIPSDFDYCQSLRFVMLYQPGMSRLQITVKSFCILPPTLTAGCYVVISLLTNCKTDEKVVQCLKTSIKQKTKIPEWEETFVMDTVQRPDLEGETIVRLDVIAFDQFSREVCLGSLKVDVAVLKDCISQEFFRTIDEGKQQQPDQPLSESSLLVGLFYHHTTQTLVLDMIKVKDLSLVAAQLSGSLVTTPATPGTSGQAASLAPSSNILKHMSYFVRARIYEDKTLVKEKRTSEKKATDEVLNESMTFNLDKRNIRNITAEFTMFIRSRKDERQLGWFSLGATSSGQVEKEHWANMLRSHASPVVQWLHFRQTNSPASPMIMTE